MTEHTIDIVYTVGSLALAYLLKIIPILALIAAAAKILGLNVPPRLTRWLAWSVVPVLCFQFFQKYFLCDFTAYYYAVVSRFYCTNSIQTIIKIGESTCLTLSDA